MRSHWDFLPFIYFDMGIRVGTRCRQTGAKWMIIEIQRQQTECEMKRNVCFRQQRQRIGRLFIQRVLCAAVKCETNCSHTYSYIIDSSAQVHLFENILSQCKQAFSHIFPFVANKFHARLIPNALIGLSQNLSFIQCMCEGFSLRFAKAYSCFYLHL